MKQKPLQNIVFGTNKKTLETMVYINDLPSEQKINSIQFQLKRYQNSITVCLYRA